ncbi:FKBP-type peptidyl-prolyl cis-trans isomerase [Flavobacterium selenitireducens]|uniref:FKBP-type peptidyl-prolyl cis-trans isomerase n=1 Tax=Flavobacterium selenitireducens TaxID=2722704 RepID=UPI00168B4287|nr:FKBP-type peptidylprolyl isomerase [Flavobacterium selenitireducens]MBD3582843.1 FKBP-type peptidylprolyl isomerase [Flavobacterium selenitireducens]
MKKNFALMSLLALALMLVNCRRDDDIGPTKARDYTDQYAKDLADIEQFLKTHRYTVINNPGQQNDQDVTFHAVQDGDPRAIWFSDSLETRTVKTYRNQDKDIDYKMYFLRLRTGGGALNDKPSPTNTDEILASYTGKYLFHLSTVVDGTPVDSLKYFEFESNPFPQANLDLQQTIKGWGEIFPQFKGGDATQIDGQPTTYGNFGAGVMFIPSALGYYNQALGSIPAYAPLIFTFKLYSVTRTDTDGDGIPNYLEDLDNDGYMYIILNEDGTGDPRPDDIDGDGAPNYLDQDDDGDNVLTIEELRRPQVEISPGVYDYTKYYYKFNGAAVDDPNTPYDDRLGAPRCLNGPTDSQCNATGSFEDFTEPTRLRNYLDPNCTKVNRWVSAGQTPAPCN